MGGRREEIESSHTWDKQGIKNVKVKARDIYDCESDWSSPLTVRMPMLKGLSYNLLLWIFEYFPNAFPILRYIFK